MELLDNAIAAAVASSMASTGGSHGRRSSHRGGDGDIDPWDSPPGRARIATHANDAYITADVAELLHGTVSSLLFGSDGMFGSPRAGTAAAAAAAAAAFSPARARGRAAEEQGFAAAAHAASSPPLKQQQTQHVSPAASPAKPVALRTPVSPGYSSDGDEIVEMLKARIAACRAELRCVWTRMLCACAHA